MANTTNLNMTKLAGTEKQKTFPSTFNGNMDAIDGAFGAGFGVSGKPTVNAEINSLADGLAIISNNNTHAAIIAGQFVYVRGHGSLSDGLYVATSNISANGALSGSNLTADSSGGLNTVYNALNSKTTDIGKTVLLGTSSIPTSDSVEVEGQLSESVKNYRFYYVGVYYNQYGSIDYGHVFLPVEDLPTNSGAPVYIKTVTGAVMYFWFNSTGTVIKSLNRSEWSGGAKIPGNYVIVTGVK